DMEDVQITEYSTAGTVKAGVPQVQDTIALTFARLRITFTPTRPNGTAGGAVSFGWDFELNKQF
ncbi:MAG TPA: hypothetical protein VLM40_22380, partial [Gemmata sp.]|nr:hypothetical protein [Gemmata sp.]